MPFDLDLSGLTLQTKLLMINALQTAIQKMAEEDIKTTVITQDQLATATFNALIETWGGNMRKQLQEQVAQRIREATAVTEKRLDDMQQTVQATEARLGKAETTAEATQQTTQAILLAVQKHGEDSALIMQMLQANLGKQSRGSS